MKRNPLHNLTKTILATTVALTALLLTPNVTKAEEVLTVQEVESNDTFESANVFKEGTILQGELSAWGDNDYFLITLSQKSRFAIVPSILVDTEYMVIEIYNADREMIFVDYLTGPVFSNIFEAGTYYIFTYPVYQYYVETYYPITYAIGIDAISVSDIITTEEKAIKEVDFVTLSNTKYTYNGKVKKPKVTAAVDKDGSTIDPKHFTVKYRDTKNVGVGTVIITFDEEYGNEVIEKSITIMPAKATKFKVTGASDSMIAVQWKMDTDNQDGYELQYATNKEFKKAKKIDRRIDYIGLNQNKEYYRNTYYHDAPYADYYGTILSRLEKNRTYYLRVRTYMIVGDKKVYSDWSSTQTVKTKGADTKLNVTDGLYYDFDCYFLCFFEQNKGKECNTKTFDEKKRKAVGTDADGIGMIQGDRQMAMKTRGYNDWGSGGHPASALNKSMFIVYGDFADKSGRTTLSDYYVMFWMFGEDSDVDLSNI